MLSICKAELEADLILKLVEMILYLLNHSLKCTLPLLFDLVCVSVCLCVNYGSPTGVKYIKGRILVLIFESTTKAC